MKPAHRRYSERDSPDWSPRTMSALVVRGRLLHIWSPWYPVTSTRRARCASARRLERDRFLKPVRPRQHGHGGRIVAARDGPEHLQRDGAIGRAQVLRQAREGRLEEAPIRREVAEIALGPGLGSLAQGAAVPHEVVEVREAHRPRRGRDAARVARQAVADRLEILVI